MKLNLFKYSKKYQTEKRLEYIEQKLKKFPGNHYWLNQQKKTKLKLTK